MSPQYLYLYTENKHYEDESCKKERWKAGKRRWAELNVAMRDGKERKRKRWSNMWMTIERRSTLFELFTRWLS